MLRDQLWTYVKRLCGGRDTGLKEVAGAGRVGIGRGKDDSGGSAGGGTGRGGRSGGRRVVEN